MVQHRKSGSTKQYRKQPKSSSCLFCWIPKHKTEPCCCS
jgi:hypothetical protein